MTRSADTVPGPYSPFRGVLFTWSDSVQPGFVAHDVFP
jgi:hypothetical protein